MGKVLLAARVCLLVALFFLILGEGQADNLDIELINRAPELRDRIDQEYKELVDRIGVLHFRVRLGNGRETFDLGTLSHSLATSLANALILQNYPERPFRILRDVTGVTAKHKVAWYRGKRQDGSDVDAERKRLFELSYPVAWGKQEVNADLFLTGVVHLSDDRSGAVVTVEALKLNRKGEPEALRPLLQFKVAADRSLLSGGGQSFLIARGGTSAERDRLAIRDARRRAQGEGEGGPNDVGGFRIEFLLNGQAVPIERDSAVKNGWRVRPPSVGETVSIRLTNVSQERLACVVKLNGRSLWREQEQEAPSCTIWVLKEGQTTTFRGYYYKLEGNNFVPFEVLNEKQAQERAAEFGNRAGLLELHSFAQGTEDTAETMPISLRGLSSRDLRLDPPASLKELQKSLMKAGRIRFEAPKGRFQARSLIVPQQVEPIEGFKISNENFPYPTETGYIMIRYYDPNVMTIAP